MDTAAATLAEPAERDALRDGAAADAWRRALLDRQLQILGRLAEAGLEIALVAEADTQRPDVDRAAAARSFARASRAVRQTVMLQSRLIKDFDAQAAAAVRAGAEAAAEEGKALQARQDARKDRISRVVERVARAAYDDKETVDRLIGQADERLDDDGLLGDVLCRPVSDIVAEICQALGLAPDWPRLAEEAWAQEELGSGEAGAPLRILPRERRRPEDVVRRAGGGVPPLSPDGWGERAPPSLSASDG